MHKEQKKKKKKKNKSNSYFKIKTKIKQIKQSRKVEDKDEELVNS